MLIEGVQRVGTGGICAGGEHVGELDDRDDVRGVAATGTFGMVGVYNTVLEGSNGGFDEAGFVQRVRMDESLDVMLVADAEGMLVVLQLAKDRSRRGVRSGPTDLRQASMAAGVEPQSS